MIGDSVVHSAEFGNLEKATNSRIRTVKAYSSVHNDKARWPHKNIADVTTAALLDTHEDDEFTQLILSAPTVDISNLDTSKLTPNDNTELFKQSVVISCKNIFTTARNALRNHPKLEKVVILEHAPRFDRADVDPQGMKPQLAKFANSTFDQLWFESPLKDKIIIGKHNLDCPDDLFLSRYRDDLTHRYDGVHIRGTLFFKIVSNFLSRPLNHKIYISNGKSWSMKP